MGDIKAKAGNPRKLERVVPWRRLPRTPPTPRVWTYAAGGIFNMYTLPAVAPTMSKDFVRGNVMGSFG